MDLGRAALLVAGEEYPGLDVEENLRLLDIYADDVSRRTAVDSSDTEKAQSVGSYLFGELGFRGNSEDYYNPDNSYFNRVLETHTGIPITLSLLFLEVARRVGVRCRGVGMPGHFLVGLAGDPVYFDPFNGGTALSVEDCQRLAGSLFGNRLRWNESYLAPCTKYEFLFRLLNNLKVVYERTSLPEKALGVAQRMMMVNPQARWLQLDLASLQCDQHQYRAALSTLEAYLREAEDGPDARQVKTWMESIRVTLNRLN